MGGSFSLTLSCPPSIPLPGGSWKSAGNVISYASRRRRQRRLGGSRCSVALEQAAQAVVGPHRARARVPMRLGQPVRSARRARRRGLEARMEIATAGVVRVRHAARAPSSVLRAASAMILRTQLAIVRCSRAAARATALRSSGSTGMDSCSRFDMRRNVAASREL